MWNALSQQVRRSSAALRAYQRLRSAVVQRQSSAARIVEIDIDQHTQQPMSETHRESTRCDPHKKIQSVAAARSWTDFRSARASSNGEIKAVDLLSRLLQRPPEWRSSLPSASGTGGFPCHRHRPSAKSPLPKRSATFSARLASSGFAPAWDPNCCALTWLLFCSCDYLISVRTEERSMTQTSTATTEAKTKKARLPLRSPADGNETAFFPLRRRFSQIFRTRR